MNKSFIRPCCLCGAAIVLLSGCQKTTEEEPAAETVSQTVLSSSEQNAIHSLIESYYAAVAAHDYEAITALSSEEFIWNYDQTGFYDYCRRITAASPVSIEDGSLLQEGDRLLVPVQVSLTYDAPHLDEEGVSQDSGLFDQKMLFVLSQKGDEYRIEDIRSRVMG